MQGERDWQDDLSLIGAAAREAADIALRFFRRDPEVWWKNEGRSPVSAADLAANAHLRDVLLGARPDYGWLSEENDDDRERLGRRRVFVVDPIDGTRAFLSGEPVWCVSVAVVEDGVPVAAILVAPALGEEYAAAADGPALKNGASLAIAPKPGDEILSFSGDENVIRHLDGAFAGGIRRIGRVPSLAYRIAMVADGRLDGTVIRRNSHDWDLAAADLVLRRAGGALSDLAGNLLAYNRAEVSRDMLVAGSPIGLQSLRPHLPAE